MFSRPSQRNYAIHNSIIEIPGLMEYSKYCVVTCDPRIISRLLETQSLKHPEVISSSHLKSIKSKIPKPKYKTRKTKFKTPTTPQQLSP